MRQAATSVILITALWATQASAQCVAPIAEVQKKITAASVQLKKISDATVAAEAKKQKASLNISEATQQLVDTPTASHRALTKLRASQSAYDEARQEAQNLLIARLETERALRGANQALNEAIENYSTQGEALISAVERARRGQVTPSLTDPLACEQGDCERIKKTEHAAMITMGAIADTVDPSTWPPQDRTCDFTILSPDIAKQVIWRGLATTQLKLQFSAQDADAALRNTQRALDDATKTRDTELAAMLESSDADFLQIAAKDLVERNASLPPLLSARDGAKMGAMMARAKASEATETSQRQLDYWADIGRAVVIASVQIERNAIKPRNTLEAAALAVMGADPASKAKACLLKTTAARMPALVFAPIPTPQC